MKINYELESFHQCKIFLLQGTDNLDHAAVANEFLSKTQCYSHVLC